MMKKSAWTVLLLVLVLYIIGFFAGFGGAQSYPYPQDYTKDQRRFDEQQAANLTMRRLQPSTTGQWAVAVVDVGSGSSMLTISTASYGVINTTGTSTITPAYSVTRFSFLSIGGLTTVSTNKTDGALLLDDGMGYEQIFDNPVSSATFSINITTGAVFYAITGVK